MAHENTRKNATVAELPPNFLVDQKARISTKGINIRQVDLEKPLIVSLIAPPIKSISVKLHTLESVKISLRPEINDN
jgi:hypothetical protein